MEALKYCSMDLSGGGVKKIHGVGQGISGYHTRLLQTPFFAMRRSYFIIIISAADTAYSSGKTSWYRVGAGAPDSHLVHYYCHQHHRASRGR